MKIFVCPLSHLSRAVKACAPERIVSLLDPGALFPETGSAYQGRHLRLPLHDIHHGTGNLIPPNSAHIDELLSFVAAWRKTAPLLIHCHAGMSRSPAAAYIAACQINPDADEVCDPGDEVPRGWELGR